MQYCCYSRGRNLKLKLKISTLYNSDVAVGITEVQISLPYSSSTSIVDFQALFQEGLMLPSYQVRSFMSLLDLLGEL